MSANHPPTRNAHDYDDLADAAEAGQLRSKPGTRRTGSEAVEASRAALLHASGTTSIEQVAQLTLGRPRLGSDREAAGPSRQINVRVNDHLYAALTQVAEQLDTSLSTLVRQALADRVTRHDAEQPGSSPSPAPAPR
ncbi:MAG: ribbon-helix-helix protein, CopG family [Ornithinimicrobium sp.]